MTERISRRLARDGTWSRREAEALVDSGVVAVNGAPSRDVKRQVSESDIITVNGATVDPKDKRTRLWSYYKPAGVLSTHDKLECRPIVFAQLPDSLPRVVSVGRLDMKTEGLLLLTNDGKLAHALEQRLPSWEKTYEIQTSGQLSKRQVQSLAEQLPNYKWRYGSVLTATGQQDIGRQQRRILDLMDRPIQRLCRTRVGPFELGQQATNSIVEWAPDDWPVDWQNDSANGQT